MSYILDALKRAERERKQGQVSVLDEIPTAPVTAEPRRRLPAWLPILLALVVLALLVYALLAWRHHGGKDAGIAASPPPPPAQVATAGNIAPPPGPALEAVAAPHGAPPPPQAPTATIEDGGQIATLDDIDNRQQQPPPDQQPDQAPGQQLRPPPGPPPGGERGQMRRGPPPATLAPQGMAPGDNAAAANEAAPSGNDAAPPDDAAAANATPDAGMPAPRAAAQEQVQQAPAQQRQLREMPEDFRANFPAFTVDVHAYNSNPQRRFVLVSGKRYHEGDTMAEGPRIIGIVPEGLVLDWQGQQVLYAIAH